MFTKPVSSWTMSLKRRASYMLLPAVIWWLGNVPLENVSARKVAICIHCPPVGACGPVRTIGADFPTACAAGPFRSRSRGDVLSGTKWQIAETHTYFSILLAAVYPCYHLIVKHLRHTTDVKRWFRKGGLTGSSGHPGPV